MWPLQYLKLLRVLVLTTAELWYREQHLHQTYTNIKYKYIQTNDSVTATPVATTNFTIKQGLRRGERGHFSFSLCRPQRTMTNTSDRVAGTDLIPPPGLINIFLKLFLFFVYIYY